MHPYEAEAVLRRPLEEALAAAEAVLAAAGFRVTDRPRDGLVAESPGYTSTNQNPLLAAGRVKLAAAGCTLRADADMRGAEWMRRFVLWFPLGIGLFLAAALGSAAFAAPAAGRALLPAAVGAPLLAVLPLAVLGPVVGRSVRRKAEAALRALVFNAAG